MKPAEQYHGDEHLVDLPDNPQEIVDECPHDIIDGLLPEYLAERLADATEVEWISFYNAAERGGGCHITKDVIEQLSRNEEVLRAYVQWKDWGEQGGDL